MIFYFSATGNTRWAAQRLAEVTRERMVFIPDVVEGDCQFEVGISEAKDEDVWIVFPVHGWRPPTIVRRFIGKLTILPHHPASGPRPVKALCTAGDSIGLTMEILRKDLAKRGLCLKDAYSLIMPESYVGLPFMDVDTKEREQAKLKKAEEDLKRITDEGKGELHKGPIPWFFSVPVGAFFANKLVSDKHFRVEKDKCIKCGRCYEACPTDDIQGGKGASPEWKHNGRCLTCFACYHHCPTHAIEFGRRTKGKGQYFYHK